MRESWHFLGRSSYIARIVNNSDRIEVFVIF
jgi:hypothetical protein